MERRFQSYRGTWAWLAQRLSAICLVLLIPVKIYSGWATLGKVPFPQSLVASARVHLNASIDILLLFFFLLHSFYGIRVMLIDFGLVREDTFFWRTMAAAGALFGFTVWFVYLYHH
jgi:succinate dehydrogenase hydrophobic anchor subunit